MIRKTRLHNKIGTKVIATAMAAAMGLSSFSAAMPGGIAYAENGDGESDAQTVVSETAEDTAVVDEAEGLSSTDENASAEVGETEENADQAVEGAQTEDAKGTADEEVSDEAAEKASDETKDEGAEKASDVEEVVVEESGYSSRDFDSSKTDVWDFGAENLGDGYNNRLDVDTINGFYSVAPGSVGVNIASFSVDDGDLEFNDGGYPATHRLRSSNTDLTRYDDKSLKDGDGNVYSGYIYSNKGKTSDVYVALDCRADDTVTFYVASNGTDSLLKFENMSDSSDVAEHLHTLGSSTVSKAVFYPAADAKYKIYSSTEKLVVARVYREHAEYATLTGNVSGFGGTDSFDVVFTNSKNGNEVVATVSDGTYSAVLAQGFDYDLSLRGADGYVITTDKTVNISGDQTMDMEVSAVELVEYSGCITGIASEDIDKFVEAAVFTFDPQDEESVFEPVISLQAEASDIYYTLSLQKGVTYDVSVADRESTSSVTYAAVEDYDLVTTAITVDGAREDFDIELTAKPVYNVTIQPVGATLADLAEATFTFTRLDEKEFVADGYVYEFTGAEEIALRDGQYVVEVSNSGAFVQKRTSDLVVNGADVTKEIAFSSDITEWDFSDAAFAAKFANATEGTYNGLSWTNGRSHNGVYLYSGAGKITVPVKGACQIQVTANYQYSYYFENDTEESVGVKTGSTSQNDTFTYNYTGAAGTFDITVLGTSYITKIATVYQTEFKDEIRVGSSEAADYATINEALAAVRLMNRADGERVTISVEPGDYEEMLVIDVPNVTLKNASQTPSNTLKNSGVDIDDNAVRVTWYYGHGYTYYSMGSDYKYDADVLAVNKANGYPSVINPGSGTGTYWNASVVVSAPGFEAKDIIFENSFNQYVSRKAAEDVIVPQSGAKEGSVARASMVYGDTAVQNKKYVERAAALALTTAAKESYFENCRFIGRQDTLYGAVASTAAFYNCAVYGGTDYIFGGMTAVFAKCDLVLNTSEDSNDVAYITAAQQQSASSRGYLMYNCTVKSTTPGVDTASKYTSKPGQFGRPWQANTSEVVFYDTVVETTNWTLSSGKYEYDEAAYVSLIQPAGWNTTLGGESNRNVEYGTLELSGEDNSAARVAWVQQPATPVCADGAEISVATFLGEWDPFTENNDDMTIVFPEVPTPPVPTPEGTPDDTTVFVLEASDLTPFAAGAKADGDSEKAGTDDFFTLIYSAKTKVDSSTKTWEDEYTSSQRINFGGVASPEKNAIKFTTANSGSVKIWWAQGGDDSRQIALLNSSGTQVAVTEGTWTKNSPYISTLEIPEAGTYYLGSVINNNYIFKVEVTLDVVEEPVVYEFEATNLTAFAAGAKADGDAEKAGTDDYFTLLYSAKSKVDSSTKTWEDGYASGQRVNFGGSASTEKNSVKFTTTQDNAELKIWWASNGREMVVLDATGNAAYKTEPGAVKNEPYISTITLEKAGTYYLGGDGGTNYIFKVQVTDGAAGPVARKSWSDVAAPVIEKVELNAKDAGKVDVTVNTLIGSNGGDSLVVTMFDSENQEITSSRSVAEKDSFTLSFAPTKSGEYTFVATLARDDEETVKTSEASAAFAFVLPLTAPQFKNAVNKGAGTVQVKFYSVAEATEYTLIATDKTDESAALVKATVTPDEVVDNTSTEYVYSFVGLSVGHVYEFTLSAKRGEDVSPESKLEVEVTSDGEREWVFSAFGSGVSSSKTNNGATANKDGSVTVWSTGNKGKIVPASTDGLSFYYTAVPSDMNFTLTATATIDTWAFTNGQEGFGLMAADRVGVNGDASVFWNNSYMASGTKVEYYYDPEKGAVKDDTAAKITMKLGLGAQQKVGVNKDNLGRLEANDTATVTGEFSSEMFTLETSCGASGAGTYNLFGKESSGTVVGTVANPLTTLRLRIQKNNTGYFVSYLDENDNVISVKKFYDTEALNKLDENNVYVGFFASRTFKATFSDIELTLIDPSEDAPAEDKPITYVVPSYKIVSATNSNTAKYELTFVGNADGVLTIADENGKKVVDGKAVKANELVNTVVKLVKGDNNFNVTFTPDDDFLPDGDQYKRLESYETVEFTHTVKYATVNDSEKVFVSPEGKADAEGTEADPVDIYTAVKYVQPGQTIELAAGTYNLSSTVKIERGIDGTPSKPIRMVASNGRAVFDFGKKCAGFIFAGNYWYVSGIDCTKSGNSLKGIQVSGSHITLEDVRAYENGNTGIQLSRYLSTDDRDLWPSYDLILNCTSYSNADAGYEDADGFAAKLTVGDGIVFDGCIAYNNADDGWDLFAKVETGCIGQVTIQNCVAFANGYGVDGTNEGNGNGFKMGGSSMSGPHKLINSVAWGNKAKGIDSNSGPDIQVYNSMSFNNGANNVALYTNDTANTDFYVDGVISYRTQNTGTNENLKAKGTQDKNKIYGKLNFFWNDGASSNSEGLKLTDDCFVSLDAPYANVSDPYAVAAGLRGSDGSINLGDFMKLSENGNALLSGAGIEASDVTASLDGNYEAIKDERSIEGSSENAQEDAKDEDTVEGKFVNKWGKTYFVADDGTTPVGIQTIDGEKYYINAKGVIVKNDYVTVDDTTYYFNPDGHMVTGFMTKWTKTYYFDENGAQLKDTLVTVDGYTYYLNAKGAVVKQDFVELQDGTHYFDGDGHMVVGRTMTKWLKKYTFDENGVLVD